ncbi:MAG: hypothetical protein ACREO4_09250 [Lysobacter sp.]
MYPSKTFNNDTSQPIFVSVTAVVDDNGFVTTILAAGGTVGLSEIQRAESQRILNWIRETFVGQSERFFAAHNGIVPHAKITMHTSGSADPLNLDQRDRRFAALDTEQLELRIMAAGLPESAYRIPMSALKPLVFEFDAEDFPSFMQQRPYPFSEKPEIHIVNTIEAPGVTAPEFAKRIAEHIMRKNPELNPKPEPEVGHRNYTNAPRVGTYWRDLERSQRFFFVQSTHECEGHSHVRMLRVDNQRGGVYDFPFSDGVQWGKMFEQVTGKDVPGNPYAAAGSVVYAREGDIEVSFGGNAAIKARDLTDQQIDRIVVEHGEKHPGLREFLVDARKPERKVGVPPELGMPYAGLAEDFKDVQYSRDAIEQQIESYRKAFPEVGEFFKRFIGSVEFTGNEVPPAAGERYYSYISNQTYTVIDASRKLHSEDYYITMERDGDKHRTKFTYRDHATWLSVWRPLDDEGKPRKVEMVEVGLRPDEEPAILARGEEVLVESNAERQLRIIYAELDRRVPGWREAGDGDHVFLDDVALAKRAIRSLFKHMNNYCSLAQTSNTELAKTTAAYLKVSGEKARIEREMRDVIAGRRGGWDAARVRVEQDSTREMLRLFTSIFARAHGKECAKLMLSAFNATTLGALPPELHVAFMARCEEYARRNEG